MDAQQFLANFGYIANAPNGVSKLRALVLVLAIHGKLVPQKDGERADRVLSQIENEKQQLMNAHKIRAVRQLPAVEQVKEPHLIPSSWAWVRFGQIASHNSGKTLDSARNRGISRDYITTSNLY